MYDRPLFTEFGPEPHCLGRIWLAFGMMPFVSAVLGGLLWGGSGPVAILSGVSAIFVTISGGLPAYLTLKQRGPISLSQTVWTGAALGNLPLALFGFMSALFALAHVAAGTISQHLVPISSLIISTIGLILLGSILGAASAAVFWFVAIKGTDLSD